MENFINLDKNMLRQQKINKSKKATVGVRPVLFFCMKQKFQEKQQNNILSFNFCCVKVNEENI